MTAEKAAPGSSQPSSDGTTFRWAVLLIGRDVRVLGALNFGADLGAGQTLLDFFLTWLVIVAGSDRIGELVASKHGATSVEAKPEPIKIEGSVFLVDAPDKAKVVAGRS